LQLLLYTEWTDKGYVTQYFSANFSDGTIAYFMAQRQQNRFAVRYPSYSWPSKRSFKYFEEQLFVVPQPASD